MSKKDYSDGMGANSIEYNSNENAPLNHERDLDQADDHAQV